VPAEHDLGDGFPGSQLDADGSEVLEVQDDPFGGLSAPARPPDVRGGAVHEQAVAGQAALALEVAGQVRWDGDGLEGLAQEEPPGARRSSVRFSWRMSRRQANAVDDLGLPLRRISSPEGVVQVQGDGDLN